MLTSLIIREEESVWRQRVMLSKEVFIVLCLYLNHNIGQCHHHHNHYHLCQVPFCQSLEVYLLPSIRDKLTALEAALACRFIIVIITINITVIIIIILMMNILSS